MIMVQVAPESAEASANGLPVPAAENAVPAATTTLPCAATYSSAARAAPAGLASTDCRQALPSADSQAAGRVPAAPTAAKPRAVAVTALISVWPCPALPAIAAVRQPARPGAYQAAAVAA